MTLLTTRRFHPTAIALVNACKSVGAALIPSQQLDWRSELIFQWSYDLPRSRSAIRGFCKERGIDFVNPRVMGKWSQIKRFIAEGVPFPESKYAKTREDSLVAAKELGFPVVLKPLFGLQSRGIVLIEDEKSLNEKWRDHHRIVQTFLPEGRRCARLMVVGDRVIHAVVRVAKDGFRATYAHGRRATLEPFGLTAELEKLAIKACRALEVSVGGVDLVQTAKGPRVLEVNHRIVEFTDRDLHGENAVQRVASYLCERARNIAYLRPHGRTRQERRICIVTGLPNSRPIQAIRCACEKEGLEVRVGSRIDFKSEAVLFWGLTYSHYRIAAAKAKAIGLPSINGQVKSLWEQRGILYKAGIKVPRSRQGSNITQAIRLARVVGYPVYLQPDKDPQRWRRNIAVGKKQLEKKWPDGMQCIIEEVRWAMLSLIRIWISGEKAIYAEQRLISDWVSWTKEKKGGVIWRPIKAELSQSETAVKACCALNVDMGIVELVPEPDGNTVVRVLHRNFSLAHLPRETVKGIYNGLVKRLLRLIGSNPSGSDDRSRAPLCVGLARPYSTRGTGYRVWHIYALYRELLRQGHQILPMHRRFDPELVDKVDFILQDPLHAFGFRRYADRLNRLLYRQVPERSHLLRRTGRNRADKRAMAWLAKRLEIRAPVILSAKQVDANMLPVIVKPRRGSLGQGVRLVWKNSELQRMARGNVVIQEYIDSGTSYALSIRVITVAHKIVAAALFYNYGVLHSNLIRGGRAIALTGPGRLARPTPEEINLLERVHIDPVDRSVPKEVEKMSTRVGQYYAERGVQMLGQDYIVDNKYQWYFLEVNTAFGVSIFNVTDGEGYPNNRKGFFYAGKVLEVAIAEIFNQRM